jgi:hypothetical protein
MRLRSLTAISRHSRPLKRSPATTHKDIVGSLFYTRDCKQHHLGVVIKKHSGNNYWFVHVAHTSSPDGATYTVKSFDNKTWYPVKGELVRPTTSVKFTFNGNPIRPSYLTPTTDMSKVLVHDSMRRAFVQAVTNVSKWPISKDKRKMPKDPAHTYNPKLALAIAGLKVRPDACRALILDTDELNTTRALINAGLQPTHIYSPNISGKITLAQMESKMCIATTEPYQETIRRLVKDKIQLDVVFLDCANAIMAKTPDNINLNGTALCKQLHDLFSSGILASECIVAFTTSKKRCTKGTMEEYGKSAQQFMSQLVASFSREVVDTQSFKTTTRSFYQCFHLKSFV